MIPSDIARFCRFYRERLSAHGIRPTVNEVMPLVRAFMALPDNTSGGWLHIVLDDGNIGDDSVDFCIGEAEKNCDEEAEELARLLRIMSHTQRKRIYMGR